MTTDQDTRSASDNSGGVPTDEELLGYLQEINRSISLKQLAESLGATRARLKPRIKSLEQKGLIIASIGLYHVSVRAVGSAQPVTDGGTPDVVSDVDLTTEQILTLLSNERRRETIRVLARQSRRDGDETTYAPVSPLSAVVCASDEDFAPASDASTDDQHSTYVALTQTHLPLLHDNEVIEYHSRVQKVEPTGAVLALDQLLDIVDDVAGDGLEESE